MTILLWAVFFLFRFGHDNQVVPSLPDHSLWNSELRKYVSADGHVNYKEWARHQEQLDAYLKSISVAPPSINWSRNVQLSYWLNVFNAYTVKLVCMHYPLQSILDIAGGQPWDTAWIQIGDRTYTLRQIEYDMIRMQFKEPFIDFALCHAARSSPPLLDEAYDPARLDSQFAYITTAFINNRKCNQLDGGAVELSALFEQHKEDFKPDILPFINKYATQPVDSTAQITYAAFDWRLNE